MRESVLVCHLCRGKPLLPVVTPDARVGPVVLIGVEILHAGNLNKYQIEY